MKSSNWNGWVYEHIFVVQTDLNRRLLSDEVVHHLDSNRENNVRSNLIVLSHADHIRLHAWIDSGAPLYDITTSKYITDNGKPYSINTRCLTCKSLLENTKYKYCGSTCQGIANRVVTRPTREKLLRLLSKYSWVAIGRHYGVSDNAVRRWARAYNII